jgi:hypothetical protein
MLLTAAEQQPIRGTPRLEALLEGARAIRLRETEADPEDVAGNSRRQLIRPSSEDGVAPATGSILELYSAASFFSIISSDM